MQHQDPDEIEASPPSSPHPRPDDIDATQAVDTSTAGQHIDRPRGRRAPRTPSLLALTAALVGVVALAGVGYSMDQDLAVTRTTLATTTSNLDSTTATLTTTNATLDHAKTVLAETSKERGSLDESVTELSAKVQTQTDCAALQSSALDELSRIATLQIDNFNKTAEASTWAKADDARESAITTALSDYYQAYSKAFVGSRSAARVEAGKGDKAASRIKAEEKTMTAEQKLVDAAAGEIEKALDALEAKLGTLETTCRAVAP